MRDEDDRGSWRGGLSSGENSVKVVGVSCDNGHNFSKPARGSIRLIAGLGVEGDAHLGVKVQHLSRVLRDPDSPNLRQVHLIHAELHDELRGKGFKSSPAIWARTSPLWASTCSGYR